MSLGTISCARRRALCAVLGVSLQRNDGFWSADPVAMPRRRRITSTPHRLRRFIIQSATSDDPPKALIRLHLN